MLILGSHMSIAGGFAQAAEKTGKQYGANAMQIFTKSPRGGNVKPIDPTDAEKFKTFCAEYKIQYVIAHSAYLLNFGKSVKSLPWMKQNILSDFQRLHMLGGKGIIVHIGKALDGERQQAIQNVIDNAKYIVDQTEKLTHDGYKGVESSAAPLGLEYILENTAGQGSEIGYRLEELAQIWKGLHGFSPRIRSCIDTAHVWGAGYDISDKSAAEKFLKDYDEAIGLNTVSCFHFNDSKKECGSKLDRHENIGSGMITSGFTGVEGLKTIAQYAKKHKTPLILETPEDTKTHLEDINTVRSFFE